MITSNSPRSNPQHPQVAHANLDRVEPPKWIGNGGAIKVKSKLPLKTSDCTVQPSELPLLIWNFWTFASPTALVKLMEFRLMVNEQLEDTVTPWPRNVMVVSA